MPTNGDRIDKLKRMFLDLDSNFGVEPQYRNESAAVLAAEEVDGDFPYLAIFTFLQKFWKHEVGIYLDPNFWEKKRSYPGPAMRLLARGADPADLAKLAAYASLEAIQSVLERLDAGRDWSVSDEYPWWGLMEVDPKTGQLTGRKMEGLHEIITALDPRGLEGQDLFQ